MPDIGPGWTAIPACAASPRAAAWPGPHVALLGLTHGNEISGGIVLDRLLRGGFEPTRGRLTFGFVNLAAFQRFDPRQPTASRFVDEDINRVWDGVLDGPRHSVELERAREIRPLIDTVDVLIDLHSMLWPSEPVTLCGETEKGKRLALENAVPAMVVADRGHAGGKRIIDYPRFADPHTPYVGNLIEAGQHWEPATVDTCARGGRCAAAPSGDGAGSERCRRRCAAGRASPGDAGRYGGDGEFHFHAGISRRRCDPGATR